MMLGGGGSSSRRRLSEITSFVVASAILAALVPTADSSPIASRGNDGEEEEGRFPKTAAEREEDLRDYVSKIDRMEFEDILSNLNNLLGQKQQSDDLDSEADLLSRVRQYEALKEAMKDLAPFLQIAASQQQEAAQEDEDDEEEKEAGLVGQDRFAKRMLEKVDKEDDWLGDYDDLYSGSSLPERDEPLLSSRRRIYPTDIMRLTGDDAKDNYTEEDEEEEDNRRLSKKDAESLAYQADPSLTVRDLSPEPQISFRKFRMDKDNKESAEVTTALPKLDKTTQEPTTHRPRVGMKEIIMMRPAVGTKSPLDQLAEERDLAAFAAMQQQETEGAEDDSSSSQLDE